MTHKKNEIIIYQARTGAIELRGDISHNTVWATQSQIAEAFDVNTKTINEHILNIIKTKELDATSTIRNFRIVRKEGTREVDRQIKHYNLDMILSVGYRVNSKKATLFRQWATKTLRKFITDGYVVNKKRIASNYSQFTRVIEDIKKLLPYESEIKTRDTIELVSLFADTWLSLDAYDKETLPKQEFTKRKVILTAEAISTNLDQLKSELLRKSEATDIFGMERVKGSIEGIVGNVMQSFEGKDLYESVEEKAAHLLYFMVKNHPFTDGNKRCGAFAFIWYLRHANILNVSKLTPSALTAITILVACSSAKDKNKVVDLILNLITYK